MFHGAAQQKKAKPIKIDALTIFISQDPHRDLCFKPSAADKTKPYIRVKIKVKDSQSAYFKDLFKAGLGVVSEIDGVVTLSITGYRNVFRALEKIEKWKVAIEEGDSNAFEELKKVCDVYLKEKASQPTQLPRKAKQLDQFEEVDSLETNDGVVTRIYNVYKKKKTPGSQKPDSLYIGKESPHDRSSADDEVFNSMSYRLLLNDRHPKTRGLYKGSKRLGLLSKYENSFQSFYDIYWDECHQGKFDTFTANGIVESEVVKVWMAAYLEKENDLHPRNYGKYKQKFAYKIDSGRSEWPLVSKYDRIDPELPYPDSFAAKDETPIAIPAESFKLRVRDIRGFPFLESTRLSRWPVKGDAWFSDLCEEAQKNKKFQDDKYFIAFKRALIPDSAYQALGLAAIKSNKKRAQRIRSKCARTRELKKELLSDDDFFDYLETPGLLESVLADFEKYNNDFKKPEDEYLKVNIEAIKKNFQALKASKPSFFEQHVFLRNLLISLGAVAAAAAFLFSVGAILGLALPGLGITAGSFLIVGSLFVTIVVALTIAFLLPLMIMLGSTIQEKCSSSAEDDFQLDATIESGNVVEQMSLVSEVTANTKTETKIDQVASVNCFSVFKLPFMSCTTSENEAPCEVTPLIRPFGL